MIVPVLTGGTYGAVYDPPPPPPPPPPEDAVTEDTLVVMSVGAKKLR